MNNIKDKKPFSAGKVIKILKAIMYVAVFCILFIGIGKVFRYILIDDSSSYTRIMMHELYNQEDNIDILFVGSSHCYRTFVPEITDRIFEKNTFNAGSSSQPMRVSYELIREAAKYNDIQHIYLDVYYDISIITPYSTSMYIISDYMKPSFRKYSFMLGSFSKKNYINGFFIERRRWDKFFDPDYVMSLIQKKQSPDYKNYTYTDVTGITYGEGERLETESYEGKGYVSNNGVIRDNSFFSKDGYAPINLEKITQDWKNSLNKIIKYCQKEGIELTLISTPMSNYLLAGVGNYDEYISEINELIEGTDVAYYDFNLCREEYFPSDSENFCNPDHVNCYGAEKFSTLFSEFCMGRISDDELFYDSYQEKLDNMEPSVLGISYKDIKGEVESENMRDMKIVSNRLEGFEYRVTMAPNKSEQYCIQDFSDNKSFCIPKSEHGLCTIEMRDAGSQGNVIDSVVVEY